jgi:signal transduction histidine kinase
VGRTAPPDSPRRRFTIGVRARILATVLVLAALGMAISGAAFTVFEQRQLLDHVQGNLTSEVKEFTSLATMRGKEGADVPTILRTALEQQVPAEDKVVFALVDRRLAYVAPATAFNIQHEPELLATIAALPIDAKPRLQRAETSAGWIWYSAVQVAGKPQLGTYVVAISLKPAQERLAASARMYAALSGAALALIAVGGWIVAGRLLRPLRLLRQATERISHNDLASRLPVTGRDDVTELTRTVNAMLDRLQGAFDTQQQFLDDAGHELRTPLTIVRGHLEVCDPGDPAEVIATQSLVMDELDRMARLVNDLIVLAQAGRPDFVRFEPVDLDRLLQDVLSKAEGLAERRWVLDSTVGAIALADAQRLTQAMLQLCDNAVRHTVPDDVIGVGGVVSRGQVQLWVRDSGPGVAAEDAQRIFERFGRAGTVRGDDGSGLGLSIVAGIAAAHGGQVELDRAYSGSGARFTLVLPLAVVARTDRRQAPGAPPRMGRPTRPPAFWTAPPGRAPAWPDPAPAQPAPAPEHPGWQPARAVGQSAPPWPAGPPNDPGVHW